MKLKVWFTVILLVVCAAMAVAEEPKMSAEEKAAMELMAKAATPGDAHKLLNDIAGTWNTKVTSWMNPGAPPSVSEGTSENKWILGGRYLEQRFKGNFMGTPFEGLGYTGYDNVTKKYWGTWMDNFSTGVMTSTGSTPDNGKTWSFTGTSSDPMTGKETEVQEKIIVTDHDHHTFEMWGAGPDGKPMKMMEITYTRKK